MAGRITPMKIVFLGDGAAGKTCLGLRYMNNAFPGEYIPTVFDNYSNNVEIDGTLFSMSLWDVGGGEDYDRLRPLSYPQTDVFILCFSVSSPTNFSNIKTKWHPEISHHCPGTSFILCGTKSDLRVDIATKERLAERNLDFVSVEQAEKLAKELKAVCYIETSALEGINVAELIEICGKSMEGKFILPKPTLPLRRQPPKFNVPQFRTVAELKEDISRGISSAYLQEPKLADIKISTFDDSVTILGHKIILASKSDLFNRLLTKRENKGCFSDIIIRNIPEKISENKQEGKLKRSQKAWYQTYQILSHPIEMVKEEKNIKGSEGRYGHSSFLKNGILYVVGGGDELGKHTNIMLCYDLEKKIWLPPINLGKKLINRNAARPGIDFPIGNFFSLVEMKDGTPLMYGGKSNGYSSLIWKFVEDNWQIVPQTGKSPPGRYGHSAVLNENKMYIFGGYDNDIGVNRDLYEFDIETGSWKYLPNSDAPPPRYCHYSKLFVDKSHQPKILVFGGRGPGETVYNDVWIYDIHTGKWTLLNVGGKKFPVARYGSAAIVSAGELFVFGGFNGSDTVFDDIWALNFKNKNPKWRMVKSGSDHKFIERYHHSVTVSGSRIIFYGGLRADHTPCLILEEGNRIGKDIKDCDNIEKVVLDKKWSKDLLYFWISSIYRGKIHDQSTEEYKRFQTEYKEDIYLPSAAASALLSISFESKSGTRTNFSDITFHLTDGDITAHRVILLSNPYTSMNLIQTNALYANELSLSMSVNTFKVLKLWLYTGDLSASSDKASLLEWGVRYGENSALCQYVIYSIVESPGIISDIVELVNVASKWKLLSFLEWIEWLLAGNYDKYKNEIDGLSDEFKARIEKNIWPGEEYAVKLKLWKQAKDDWETKKSR